MKIILRVLQGKKDRKCLVCWMGKETFLSRKYLTTTKEKQGNDAGPIKQRDGVQHRRGIKLISRGPSQWGDFTVDLLLKEMGSYLGVLRMAMARVNSFSKVSISLHAVQMEKLNTKALILRPKRCSGCEGIL